MAKIVIFGTTKTAELAHFYLTHDSEHEVVAFTVNEEYIKEDTYRGLPVVPFEEVEQKYTPGDFKMFAPTVAHRMNRMREEVYNECKGKGFELISYISSHATVFPEAQIGDNCFILEDNTLQPFTTIGNNVVLWSGNHIGHHGEIKDNVFFTSHVVMSGRCSIGRNSFFGVNATIRDGITIGDYTLVAMGASIIKDTDEWGIYMGAPAKKLDKSAKDIDSLG